MNRIFVFSAFLFFIQTTTAQPIIQLQTFATGFTRPISIASAGDERLFIVEQRGMIHILDAQGQTLPTPFLDIRSRVNSASNERGLLGLAFHPDYAENGFFYVNYTNTAGHTRIARYQVSENNPDVADPESELIIMAVNQPFSNHNAGDISFGPDGYLYFGLGDGGSGGDPQNHGQNRMSLLGKMIRIDVDNGEPYSIPPDNPFANDDFTRDEIWALGLRNPWRFSFDRLTGDMWIADVGQNAWEEINFQPASSTGGENYGWRCYEGNNTYNTSGCLPASAYTFPIHVYPNNFANGCSVTGGYVYRGSNFSDLSGHYIYADYCSGRIWALTPDGDGGWTNRLLMQGASTQYAAFGENQNGELFLAARNSGIILRVNELCSPFQVSGASSNETCPGDADGRIELSIANPGATHTVAWSTGATGTSLHNLSPGTYTVSVTNSNTCARTISFQIEPAAVVPEQPPVLVAGNVLSVPDLELFVSYQWYLNGAPISGANGPAYTALESGEYFAKAFTLAGCVYEWAPVTVTVTSIAERLGLQRFSASPNPTRDFLNIDIELNESSNLTLRLLDISGKTIWERRERIAGAWRTEADMRKLPPGKYSLVLLRGKQRVATVAVVKA